MIFGWKRLDTTEIAIYNVAKYRRSIKINVMPNHFNVESL